MHGWGTSWHDGNSWFMVIIMIVGTLAVVGLIAWALIYATRTTEPRGEAISAPNSAREVLDIRYARGEIDTAEYDERAARLREDDRFR